MKTTPGGLQACSGCAGDYEDPERSAFAATGEDEDDAEPHTQGGTGENSAPRRFPVSSE
jgi:hypothetical protein